MIQRRLKLPLAFLFVAAVALAAVGGWQRTALADVNDFVITDFKADYYLSNKDPQGEMRVVEKINVQFTDQNHGILRAIPMKYASVPVHIHNVRVTSDSGAPTKFSTSSQNDNEIVKIGDANRTVSGAQEYTVEYTLDNVLNFSAGAPELYWNVNGTQWSEPFDHVQTTVHLGSGLSFDTARNAPVCYSGTQGQKGDGCLTNVVDTRTFRAETTQPLPAYANLSFAINVSGGGLHAQTWLDTAADYWKPVAAILALPLATFIYCFSVWFKRGRDAKGSGVVVAQYDAPDGLSPVEVGTLADFITDNRDITATIIDLAVRKYIRIVETKKDRLIGKDKLSYELVLLNADFSQLRDTERTLLHDLFSDGKVGDSKQIDQASSTLAATAKAISKKTEERLTAFGYFKGNPLNAGTKLYTLMGIAFGVTILLGRFLHPSALVGIVLTGAIAYVFARNMPARTAKGVAALEHVQGLRLYLEVAEADRINAMQSPNARYAVNQNEPAKTVELFEKLLPYAIVLKVEKGWAKQFEGLYTTPPDWYAGDWSNMAAFNAGYLVGSLNDNFANAVNTSFTAPSSSGGSGFGGGGFSGGGGGGGGGGGW